MSDEPCRAIHVFDKRKRIGKLRRWCGQLFRSFGGNTLGGEQTNAKVQEHGGEDPPLMYYRIGLFAASSSASDVTENFAKPTKQ